MRKILHIDMDAFYASVEQRDFPHLVGRPVIVGGKPESRGVVAACSYEARAFGVHSAMPSSRAIKLCKDAVFMPPRFDAYREASASINKVFKRYTDIIEPLSLDEAYLDVTDKAAALGSATEVAKRIKHDIRQTVNLTASAGVSYNKFLAKIASDMDKPNGIYVIRPEVAEAFVEQLAIRKFFGIGKVTEKKMQSLGIFNGADLKRFSKIQLQTQFGRVGSYYYNIARGIDERPVSPNRQRKSLGKEITFDGNVVDKAYIWKTLQDIVKRLEVVLENKQLAARTVTLKIKYSDFQLVTRSKTIDNAIQSKAEIVDILPELLRKTAVGTRPIRLIGVTLASLQNSVELDPESPNSNGEQARGQRSGLVNGQAHGTNQLGLF